nr:MAG TPA: hypothetical protein [Bacteriophage sp.]
MCKQKKGKQPLSHFPFRHQSKNYETNLDKIV